MQSRDPLNELAKQFAEIGANIKASLQPIVKMAAQAADGLRPAMLAIAEAIQQLPDDLRIVVSALAERGWYISAEMDIPFLRLLQAAVESDNLTVIDRLMESWISSSVSEIEARAAARFPNRASIIAAGMQAHQRQEYELSVPVFLIQVEGMCVQEFGTKLYSTKKGVPYTKDFAESMIDGPITEVFLLPLCQPSGLTAGVDSRSNFPHAMNRHEILHGINTDYASHTNSLKAISLMDYFVSLVVKEKLTTAL
jgi:hypothetical protein